jgi:uncharacterized membrane protein
MTRTDYLAALTRALVDLPPEAAQRIVAEYDQRFVTGLAAGQSEDEILRTLPDPGQVASSHWSTVPETALRPRFDVAAYTRTAQAMPVMLTKRVNTVGSYLTSVLGLSVLNLALLVPAIIATAMLFAMFMTAMALYGSGIAVTASGLSGVDSLMIGGPFDYVQIGRSQHLVEHPGAVRSSMMITPTGIEVLNQRAGKHASLSVGSTHLDLFGGDGDDSRTVKTAKGVVATLAGILLLLFWLVLLKYWAIAIKRYASFNFATLANRRTA